MRYALFLLALLSLPHILFAAADFVPLTSIPAFTEITNTNDLSGFLNGVYRVCVGLAATLAVVQLVRAGIMYMGGDSVTNKKEGKDLFAASIFGLLLVLSPVIVFGIINPNVLSLEINVSGLQSNYTPSANQGGSAARCNGLGETDGSTVQPDFQDCCAAHGLHPWPQAHSSAFVCRSNPYQPHGAGTYQDNAGNHYINIPTTVGHYGTLRINPADDQTCIQLAYGAYPAQADCQTATSAHETAKSDWITVQNCRQESDDLREVVIGASVPYCEAVESL